MEVSRQSGFTTIEMIMVIVIIAVLSVVAASRWSATDNTLPYQADLLARNVRHMQILAMSWGKSLRLTSSGSTYSVACVTAAAAPCNVSPVVDPVTGAPFSVTLDNSATLTAATIDIDSLGRPVSAGTPVATSQSITLSGGLQTWTVTVAPITGFVTVSSP